MNAQQAKQKLHHDRSRVKMRDFAASDSVSVRNMQGTYAKWLPGTVIRRLGPLTYLVKVGHRLRFVHIDYLLQAHSVADPVLDAEGVEPTLEKVLNLLSMSRLCHKMLHESKRVFPEKSSQLCLSPEKSSQLRVSPEKSSQSCVSPEKSSQSCVSPRNRQRTHRCSVNVDILTEFEKAPKRLDV